jgi:hypothetical protein
MVVARLIGGDLFPQCSYKGGMVVAEEGLEPATRGLDSHHDWFIVTA